MVENSPAPSLERLHAIVSNDAFINCKDLTKSKLSMDKEMYFSALFGIQLILLFFRFPSPCRNSSRKSVVEITFVLRGATILPSEMTMVQNKIVFQFEATYMTVDGTLETCYSTLLIGFGWMKSSFSWIYCCSVAKHSRNLWGINHFVWQVNDTIPLAILMIKSCYRHSSNFQNVA